MKPDEFDARNKTIIAGMGRDEELRTASRQWFDLASRHEYSYHFKWLGLPIIQFPQDVLAAQEIIWDVKPDLIIETGIARGGSLILYASLLQLIGGEGRVLGIDIDIRDHNRQAIESHPMARRIDMIQGSSIDDGIAAEVRRRAEGKRTVMVMLDSNHTHAHVLRELELYAPLVTKGSYLLVFDTVVELMQPDAFPDRPWSVGDNPMTAVREYLQTTDRFEIDQSIEDKLQLTVAPQGYLRCVRD
ncbi:MAG TPA: cephalosporin hydroxylase family protein [Pirellulaceae bacterium]|jgi:cephalosporin hydroxylase|nr:cephalosporin hydroxylase family protein [Pirellulaceae bacterium]